MGPGPLKPPACLAFGSGQAYGLIGSVNRYFPVFSNTTHSHACLKETDWCQFQTCNQYQGSLFSLVRLYPINVIYKEKHKFEPYFSKNISFIKSWLIHCLQNCNICRAIHKCHNALDIIFPGHSKAVLGTQITGYPTETVTLFHFSGD